MPVMSSSLPYATPMLHVFQHHVPPMPHCVPLFTPKLMPVPHAPMVIPMPYVPHVPYVPIVIG